MVLEAGPLRMAVVLVEFWGRFHQHFYKQILHAQIPKHKNLVKLSVSFGAFGSVRTKAAGKILMKLIPDVEILLLLLLKLWIADNSNCCWFWRLNWPCELINLLKICCHKKFRLICFEITILQINSNERNRTNSIYKCVFSYLNYHYCEYI